ncbi:MAG: hypothetical protein KF709_03530 [Gemmatimonadaceae bacterium]|nr:hypothetical protein [Gemmatimonadaceae bacterium]
MRRLLFCVAALLLAAPAAQAQVSRVAAQGDSASEALRALDLVEGELEINGRYVRGNATVPAGDTVRGPLVVMGGSADISGVVLGNVTAIFGDVTIRDGADVRGGATAWRGRVLVEGGRVRGALRSTMQTAAAAIAPMTRGQALQLSLGWTAMLLVIALAAMLLLGKNVDATARVLADDFGRSFLLGVVGELGFLPLLLFAVVALAVTIIGLLLVPFVLAAAPVALAGVATLGWLGVALMVGRGLTGGPRDDRAATLRALGVGVLVLMVPWFIAAAMTGGTGALISRVFAIGVTWVAGTAGLGAALLSRAGTGRRSRAKQATAQPAAAGWQTPTPVAGVAAARRPVPARPGAEPK